MPHPPLALALPAALLAAASLAPPPARACSMPPTGWTFGSLVPTRASERVTALDGPIVLRGSIHGVDLADVLDGIVMRVLDGEDEIPGALMPIAPPGTLAWYPDAPLTVDRIYTVELSAAPADDPVVLMDDAVYAVRALPPEPPAEVSLTRHRLWVEEVDVSSPCDPAVCDDCLDREVIGRETRWFISLDYLFRTAGYETAAPVAMRRAIGADRVAALAALEETPFVLVADTGAFEGSAPVAGWGSPEACLAHEIQQAGRQLVHDVFCAPVPAADPDAPMADDAPGCSSTGHSGGPAALGFLALIALWRRRGSAMGIGRPSSRPGA